MNTPVTRLARSACGPLPRRRARRLGRPRARAGQGRRQAVAGPGGQARLDRSAVGPVRSGRHQPAEQLEVLRRQVQRQQRRRREVRDHRLRQQGRAGRVAERAEAGDRRRCPLHHPGQRLRRRPGAHRRDQQVQRAQSRQGAGLPERGRRRPRPHQQQVQLLALPLRRRHDDEDGSHVELHEGPEGHPQGLHPRPELFARRAGRQVREGGHQAQAPRHRDRRRGPAPDRPGARLLALHRQDQGLRRRRGGHRQLGRRSVAAGQGRGRGRLHGQVLHLLRRRHRHADGAGHERRRQGLRHRLCRRRPHGRRVRQGRLRVQGEVQRRLLHRLDHPHARGDEPGDGAGQVDRSGQGRLRDGRAEVEERIRR